MNLTEMTYTKQLIILQMENLEVKKQTRKKNQRMEKRIWPQILFNMLQTRRQTMESTLKMQKTNMQATNKQKTDKQSMKKNMQTKNTQKKQIKIICKRLNINTNKVLHADEGCLTFVVITDNIENWVFD